MHRSRAQRRGIIRRSQLRDRRRRQSEVGQLPTRLQRAQLPLPRSWKNVGHAGVHRWRGPALWGRRQSGWAAAHGCAGRWPGCGARPRLGFAARGRCGPSPSALQGRIYLRRNVSEQDVAPVAPVRRLRTANARVCTSRMPCALTAVLLPGSRARGCHMLQAWFPEWTRLGVRVARGRGLSGIVRVSDVIHSTKSAGSTPP